MLRRLPGAPERDHPTPIDRHERALAPGLREALASGEIGAVLAILERFARAVPSRRQARVVWLPCVIECARMRGDDAAAGAIAVVERFIRQRLHAELVAMPRAEVVWLLQPVRPEDATACHVAAHACATRGIAARPWPWPHVPPGGRLVPLGDDPAAAVAVRPDQRRQTLSDLVARPRSVLERLAASIG